MRAATGVLPPGTIVANARAVLALDAATNDGSGDSHVWTVGDEVAAVRLTRPLPAEALSDGSLELASLAEGGGIPLPGHWLEAPWDLIGQLPEQLLADTLVRAAAAHVAGSEAGERFGTHPVIIAAGVTIEPYVVFDASLGPVIVESGAVISSFSRIAGPCVIGERTHILGGRVGGSAIGDDCRIHGDVSASIVIGQANKAHEGFVGHSVIGRWANLGAGTTTSNLKNSYGPVRMWAPGEPGGHSDIGAEVDTALTFLGSLIGDHAKLGIGAMLGTGTVIGAGANVFGSVRPPKRVPPFAWGDAPPYETFTVAKFLDVAAKVMARRNVPLDDGVRGMLARAHELAASGAW
jgi:UDP-N-acetylglucosamine diphosphorylase/glucosamine-1-phosphate N-acetyltransferase